eukprot:5216244-Prymnesium_polylepis.1
MSPFDASLLGFLRLLRLPCLRLYAAAAARPTGGVITGIQGGLLRLFSLLGVVSFAGHLVGSLWLLLLDGQPDDALTWANQMAHPVDQLAFGARYLRAVYWAHSTMLTVAYGDIIPYNRGETLLCFATMLFGVFAYAALVGTLASLMQSLDKQRVLFDERHESVTVATRNDKTSQLTNRIGDFYERFWRSARGTSPSLLMQSLPRALQSDVCSFLYLGTLRRLPLFKSCKDSFLLELARCGQELLCMPGDYVTRQGERSHEMFVILKGHVDVLHAGESGAMRGSSIYDVAFKARRRSWGSDDDDGDSSPPPGGSPTGGGAASPLPAVGAGTGTKRGPNTCSGSPLGRSQGGGIGGRRNSVLATWKAAACQ